MARRASNVHQRAPGLGPLQPSEAPHTQVVEELVSNIGVVEKLTGFQHKDANGRDWGLNVRQRAKELAGLVTDPDRIRAERQKVGPASLCQVPCFAFCSAPVCRLSIRGILHL